MSTGSVQAFQPVATVALAANAVTAQSATIVRTAPIFAVSPLVFGQYHTVKNAPGIIPAVNPYNIVAEGENVLVFNDTTDVCFVVVGGDGTVADFTGYPVPAGGSRLIAFGAYCTTVSAISNSVNSGTIFVTVGNGTQY